MEQHLDKDYPDRMTPEQARTFRDDVLNIVGQIPRGRVTTYGTIAAWAGWPSHDGISPLHHISPVIS